MPRIFVKVPENHLADLTPQLRRQTMIESFFVHRFVAFV
jgi:hypothetical protein